MIFRQIKNGRWAGHLGYTIKRGMSLGGIHFVAKYQDINIGIDQDFKAAQKICVAHAAKLTLDAYKAAWVAP